jgi:hypothetical protein
MSRARRNPRYMADEFELMKELAAAAEPCFDTADRLAVYCEMNLGALQHPVDDLISAVVRNDHPMAAGLIDASAHALAFELAGSVKYRRLDCTLENRSRTKR